MKLTLCKDGEKMLAKLKSEYEKEPNSIETNRAIAEYYFKNDMLEEAEPHLIKMLDIDDEIISAHNQLGMLCFKRSQYSKAESHFRKVLQMDFGATEAHFNLASLCQTQGRFKEALPLYKEVVRMDQNDAETYRSMGQCAQAIGMQEEAEAFFVESLRLAPIAETALDLSIFYTSQEKYQEAEELLTPLLELLNNETEDQNSLDTSQQTEIPSSMDKHSDAQNASVSLNKGRLSSVLGQVLAEQGKYLDAMKHLRNAVMTDESNQQAFNCLGECCAAIDLHKEAESFFSKACKLDPQYLQPIANLGKLYYDQEQYHETIAAMEQYIEVRGELAEAQSQEDGEIQDPETGLVYELLGRAYMQLGDKEKAVEVWKRSLEMNPDQPELVLLINDSPAPKYKRITLSIED